MAAKSLSKMVNEQRTSNQEQEREAKESQESISKALNVPLDQLKVEIVDSKTIATFMMFYQNKLD